jgi:hypothetical protein
MITQSQKINGSAWILLGLTVSLQAQEVFKERNVGDVDRRLINGAETQVEWETEVTMEDGSVQVTQRGYTELDPGSNYWDDGQWKKSQAVIELDDKIGAKAIQAQQKVFFKPSVNQRGAVEIHTPEGMVLKSSVLGLSYFDSFSGQMVTLATTHRSVGELLEPNQIIYRDAFDNIHADVLYTFRTSGLEQDIIFRENPPAPELFGLLPESTKLEVMSEFYETPNPGKRVSTLDEVTDPQLRQQMAEPDWIDEELNFGNVILPRGKAFSVATANQNQTIPTEQSSPVGKRWINNGSRSALIESVDYYNVRSILETLPDAVSPDDLDQQDAGAMFQLNEKFPKTASRILPELNTSATAALPKDAIRVASYSPYSEPGFVLDYTTVSSTSDFTFSGNETYVIDNSSVVLTGTTTFEGGAVIKYDSDKMPYLKLLGDLEYDTNTYLPVIITAKDDNTVGETIGGSSGSPSGYYCEAAIWISGGSLSEISNFHIRFAEIGIKVDAAGSVNFTTKNCQFVNNDIPISKYNGTLNMYNCLLVGNDTRVLDRIGIGSVTASMVNCTVDGGSNLYNTTSLNLTNSIVTGVTSTGSPSNTNSVIESSSSGVYDSVGAGDYYLPATSGYKDAGTSSIDSDLLAELGTRTTSAPIEITSDLTVDTTWGPVIDRDLGRIDLGYHYPVVDYFVIQKKIISKRLDVLPGTVLSMGGYNGLRIHNNDAYISCKGTVSDPIIFVRYDCVQEQAVHLGSVSISERLISFEYNPAENPSGEFEFVRSYLHADARWHIMGAYHSSVDTVSSLIAIKNSEFTNCSVYYSGKTNDYVKLNNNLFVRCKSELRGFGNVELTNCTYFDGECYLNQHASYTSHWYIRNCVLEDTTVYNSMYSGKYTHSNNGYIGSGQAVIGTSSSNVVVTSFDYEDGPFGKFYQSSSDFIDEGYGDADDAGLYHFTANVTNEKERDSVLDIGYHYPAANQYFKASEGYSTTSMGPWRYEYTSSLQGLPNDLFLTWQAGSSWWGGVSGDTYCLVVDNWNHPGHSHDNVRSFIMPYDGDIMIEGSVSDGNYCSGNPNEDGVRVRVLKNTSTISGLNWTTVPANSSGVDMSTSFPVSVNAGDFIYFQTNKNASDNCDSTLWDPVIYYTSVDESVDQTILADHDGDGIADYIEDIDGDGIVDSGETDWKTADNEKINLNGTTKIDLYTPLL